MTEALAGVPAIAALVAGGLLLAFGRRLFWLFVGVLGFVVGFQLGAALFDGQAAGLVVALAAGLAGALAAVFVQRLAVAVAGFAAGAVGVIWLAELLDWRLDLLVLAAALVAGIVAAAFVRALFELALVVLSSLAGAALVVEGLGGEAPHGLFFLGLAVAGVAFQLWRGKGRRRRDESR